jgi:RNA 2',3'-cyclic 3'-phosphodiesterase
MHRLFVALPLPAPIREQLMSIMGGVSAARWQRDDQLHLTLRYIGEVDRRVADDVALALAGVHARPFDLALSGVGSFGNKQPGHALWAAVRPHEEAAALHRKIDHALVRIALEPEARAYLPHITVARLNRSSGSAQHWLAAQAGLSSPAFRVSSFGLYESVLAREGAQYRLVERYDFGS